MTALRASLCALTVGALSLLSSPISAQLVHDYGSWVRQDKGSATYMSGITFPDHRNGWAIGAINGIGPSIHNSTDGGRTWAIQSTAMHSLMYLGLDAPDQDNVFISGVQFLYPGMVMSHDGGQTWQTKDMSGFIWSSQFVQAVDARHIKVPSFWTPLLGAEKKGITISDDGGRTWSQHKWSANTYPRYCHFLDEDRGWMTGGAWPDMGKRSSEFRLAQNLPPIPNYPPEAMPRQRAGRYEAAIAKTTDGGRTWQTVFWDTDRFYLNHIFMIDDLEGWAVGDASYVPFILHTTDGWNTVQMQTPPAGAYDLMTIDMFNRNEGIAVGFGPRTIDIDMFVLHTSDGGNTWVLDRPGFDTGPMASDFIDRRTGWSVGGNNMQESTVAAYHNEGDLRIDLTSAPPLHAQPGSTLQWSASVENRGGAAVPFDVWLEVTGPTLPPSMNPYRTVLMAGLTFPGGHSQSGPVSFPIPSTAPAGTYTVATVVGDWPGTAYDSDTFVIEVD